MMILRAAMLVLLAILAMPVFAQEEAPAEPAPEPAPEAPPAPPPIELEGDEARRNVVNPMQGQPAPALSIASWVNTEGVTLEALKGQVVLLDFWGVWSGPSRGQVARLKELHEAHKEQGLTIVGVHTSSAQDQAQAFIDAEALPYVIGFDNSDATVGAYKVDSYSDVYLVDHTGVLRYADANNGNWDNIKNAVAQLLAERNPAPAPEPEPAPEPAPEPSPEPAPAEAAPSE